MRQRLPVVALGVILLVNVCLFALLATRNHTAVGASPGGTAGPTTAGQTMRSPKSTGAPRRGHPIELTSGGYVGAPFTTVRLRGIDHGAGGTTTLRVEHRQRNGWVPFPLPVTTDRSGRFTAFVEMGAAGSYHLRVIDPATNETSAVVTLHIA